MADVVAIDEESNLLCFGTVVERDFFLAFLRRRKGGKNIQELNFFSLAFQSSSPSDCSVADNISHFNWPARFFLFFFFCFWSGRQQQQIEWFPSPICKKKKYFNFDFPFLKERPSRISWFQRLFDRRNKIFWEENEANGYALIGKKFSQSMTHLHMRCAHFYLWIDQRDSALF